MSTVLRNLSARTREPLGGISIDFDPNLVVLGRGSGLKGCAPRFPPDSRSQNLKILDLVPKSGLLTSKIVRTRFREHVPGPSGPWIQAFSVGIHPPSANPSAEMVPRFWVHVPGPYGPCIQAFSPGIHPPSANPSADMVPDFGWWLSRCPNVPMS